MQSNPPGDYLKRVARTLRKAARKGHRLTMAEASKLLASGRLKADGTLSGVKKVKAKAKAKTKAKRKVKPKRTKVGKAPRRKSSRPIREYAALELDDKVIESLKRLCKLKGK